MTLHGHGAVTCAAWPEMRAGGSVVFISSGTGHNPIAGLGAYGVSKAAVNHPAAVLYFCSDLARFVTGHALRLDGGRV